MVDIHQPGDYPILLGDSLKDDAPAASSHISLRYNWVPRSGLTGNTGKIKTTSDGVSLAYDRNGEALKYTGWVAERLDADQNPQLALFYDSSKSAFVVERLAATLDLNLNSGTNITPDHINRHSQIVKPGAASQNANGDSFNEDEDESPDESNPFDYRHFLTEAKEAAEKATLAGNRTPLPGGHTPMSGLSSPMGGAHLLQSDTPQFGPVEIIDASHIEDGPEWGDRRHHFKNATKNKNARKTKAAATTARAKPKVSSSTKSTSQPMPLSNERVQSSDSDSDSDDPPAPVAPPKPKQTKKTPPKKKTQPPARSPAIIVENDSDSGGLEIQSGSPPPSLRKRGYKIDADAFRSQTGTPAITRPVSSQSNADMDVDMPDADEEADGDADIDVDDEYNKYLASDSDKDINSNTRQNTNTNVDDLILDDGSTSSPEPAPAPAPARIPLPSKPAPAPREDPPIVHAPTAQRAKRRQSSTISRASRVSRAPTRTATLDKDRNKVRSPSPAAEDSDDDGGLAKELEEALLREEYGYGADDGNEEGEDSGVGLGIEVRGGGVDEESDISEEE